MSIRTRFHDGGGAYLLLDGSRAMTDDLDIGAHRLQTTNLSLREVDTSTLSIATRTGVATRKLLLDQLLADTNVQTPALKPRSTLLQILTDADVEEIWLQSYATTLKTVAKLKGGFIELLLAKTDNLDEVTPAAGVTIEQVLLKDGGATLAGDLDLAGNDLLTDSLSFYEASATRFYIRNRVKTEYRDLQMRGFTATSFIDMYANGRIKTADVITANIRFQSYDTAARDVMNMVGGYVDVLRAGDIALIDDKFIQLSNDVAGLACNAANRGKFKYVKGGAGVKDQVEVCAKDAADAYAWRVLY